MSALKELYYLVLIQNGKFRREVGKISHVFLPVSLIILVSGYLELTLDELGLMRDDLIA